MECFFDEGDLGLKIVFFGTADFAIPVLKAIHTAGHTISAVVTKSPRPAGRGLRLRKSPLHIFAEEQNYLPILTPESLKEESFALELQKLQADIFVVVAFSILPPSLFSIPPKGTYNVHAALLPLFRGPAPIHRAIERGETETGVTVFRIDAGVDTGAIVLQKHCTIAPEETTPELYARLSCYGAEALVEVCDMIAKDTVVYHKQDEQRATRAPLLRKEEALIDWSLSASLLFNRMRAFKPFPGTVTRLNGERFEIEWGYFDESRSYPESIPGTIVDYTHDEMVISTGEGVLIINRVKPAGKRSMSVRDFLNGCRIEKGTVLK